MNKNNINSFPHLLRPRSRLPRPDHDHPQQNNPQRVPPRRSVYQRFGIVIALRVAEYPPPGIRCALGEKWKKRRGKKRRKNKGDTRKGYRAGFARDHVKIDTSVKLQLIRIQPAYVRVIFVQAARDRGAVRRGGRLKGIS